MTKKVIKLSDDSTCMAKQNYLKEVVNMANNGDYVIQNPKSESKKPLENPNIFDNSL